MYILSLSRKNEGCQNAHLFLRTKPRLSQGALLLPKDFVSLKA